MHNLTSLFGQLVKFWHITHGHICTCSLLFFTTFLALFYFGDVINFMETFANCLGQDQDRHNVTFNVKGNECGAL